MKINKTLLAVAVSVAIAGCNSSSDRDDITRPEPPPPMAPELVQGAFYDAPTNGLWFGTVATDSEGVDVLVTGFTGEDFDPGNGEIEESLYPGSFPYMEAPLDEDGVDNTPRMIEFRLGGEDGLVLGRVRGPVRIDGNQGQGELNGRHILPHNLTADSNYNLNVARLLLTLDANNSVGDPNENSIIEIPEVFKNAGNELAGIDLGRLNDEDLTIVKSIDSSILEFVSAEDAIAHLTQTKARVENENKDLSTSWGYNVQGKTINARIIRHRGDDGQLCALDLTEGSNETSDDYIGRESALYRGVRVEWRKGFIDPFDPGRGFDGELTPATHTREAQGDEEYRDRDSWVGGCKTSELALLGEDLELAHYAGLNLEDNFSNTQFPDAPVSYQNLHGTDRGYITCGDGGGDVRDCDFSELNGFWIRGFNYGFYRHPDSEHGQGHLLGGDGDYDASPITHPNNPSTEANELVSPYVGPTTWQDGNNRWLPAPDANITDPDVFMSYNRYRVDQVSRQFMQNLELMVESIKSTPLTEGVHGDEQQLGKIYVPQRWNNAQNDGNHTRNVWLPYDQSQAEELRFYYEGGTAPSNAIDMTGSWEANECVYNVTNSEVTVDGNACLDTDRLFREMFWLSEGDARLAQLNMRVKLDDSGYVRWSYMPGGTMENGVLYRFEENTEGEVINTTALTRVETPDE